MLRRAPELCDLMGTGWSSLFNVTLSAALIIYSGRIHRNSLEVVIVMRLRRAQKGEVVSGVVDDGENDCGQEPQAGRHHMSPTNERTDKDGA